jgi:hypothetical protein
MNQPRIFTEGNEGNEENKKQRDFFSLSDACPDSIGIGGEGWGEEASPSQHVPS